MQALDGLAKSGSALWESATAGRDMDVASSLLLLNACRLADRCDVLYDESTASAQTVENSKGDEVISPLIAEFRQSLNQLGTTLGKLGLGALPAVKPKGTSVLSLIQGEYEATS